MGKSKKKSKDKNGNPKPSKRAKTEPAAKPAKSASKKQSAPPAQAAPAPAIPSSSQQGGGDVEADPVPYQLGDPLPPRKVYKHSPKYWVHNLPDGYGKSAGLVLQCAQLIGVSAGLVAQRHRHNGQAAQAVT